MLKECSLVSVALVSLSLASCSQIGNPFASSAIPSPSPSATPEPIAASSPSPTDSTKAFETALEKASKASYSAENATSKEDWELTANRWQQAIELMKSLPTDDPNYKQAQENLPEYQRNFQVAHNRSLRTVSLAGYLPVDGPGRIDSVDKVVGSSAKVFLEGYMNALVHQGKTGYEFWCSKSKGERVSFFSPRSWDLLDSHIASSGRAGAFTVQLDSSNRGGEQITTNWAIVIEREQSRGARIPPGNWCVSMILEK